MRRAARLATLVMLLAAALPFAPALAAAGEHAEALPFAYGRFGEMQLFRPSGTPSSVTLLVTGDAGEDGTRETLTDALVGHGSVVVGIDGARYLAALNRPGAGCLFIGYDFEDLSHAVQQHLGLRDYLLPVLAGHGSGATLAAIAAEQSPKGTYAGLLSLAFRPGLALRNPPCDAPGLAWQPQPAATRGDAATFDGIVLHPAPRRSSPWVMLQPADDARFPLPAARAFATASGAAVLVPVSMPLPMTASAPAPRPGSAPAAAVSSRAATRDDTPRGTVAYDAAWLAAQQSLATSGARRAPPRVGELSDLPLHEVPVDGNATPPSAAFAVLLTGDGGWAGLDQDVAATLARAGIPVVALNTLKYFWSRHEPEAAARDLQRIVERYGAAWQRREVLLIGYSFGADVLPFLYRRLPVASRGAVRSVTLLAPGAVAQFEFHVSNWLPVGNARGRPTRPEIEAMGAARVLCVHPVEEGPSPCEGAKLPGLADVALAGGHHFGGDYRGLAMRILEFGATRPGTAPGGSTPTGATAR